MAFFGKNFVVKGLPVNKIKITTTNTGFVRVLENLESPEILFWHFQGLESPGKRPLVLESSGNLLNSTKCSKHLLWNLFMVAIKPNYLKCMEGGKEN